jgi:hypothetical protein
VTVFRVKGKGGLRDVARRIIVGPHVPGIHAVTRHCRWIFEEHHEKKENAQKSIDGLLRFV